ncbi:D-2-hydroxyacid dehydrogenase [Cytobacillus sp. FSL M8-0252]|uniref:D-2-hydroxyacid dehydrogenase n=1 Tax=unclassified Cytobacillus TaxID=2675268 RepID=UPI0030FC510E
MSKRKMIITQNLSEELKTAITEITPDWEHIIGKDNEVWESHMKDAEVIVAWKHRMHDTYANNANLRWIQTWSAGVNYLPLEDFDKKNILLTSANGVHAYPISETIFALMLGLTRSIDRYVKQQQEKVWNGTGNKLEMHGKTIGIIGVGMIGQETARIAKAFNMHVIGVRHSGKPVDYVDEMYTSLELDDILPKCDYIVVTLPLTKDTYHMFSKEQFKRMKQTAFFINIGRGEIVDENALYHALSEGEIKGAGIDVFEKEPLPEDSPLWGLNNLIITPHTSGSTEHYNERVIKNIFIPNLKKYLNGDALDTNVVDYKKGY